MDGARTYTVTVSRSENAGKNALNIHAETGWLLYRVYLPNAGAEGMGGVPLPGIAITDTSVAVAPLPPCEYVNRRSALTRNRLSTARGKPKE